VIKYIRQFNSVGRNIIYAGVGVQTP